MDQMMWILKTRAKPLHIGYTEPKAICIQTNINMYNHMPRLFSQSGMPFSGYVLVTLSVTFSSKLPLINTVLNNPETPQQLFTTLLQFG